MVRTVPVEVRVADLPQIKQFIASVAALLAVMGRYDMPQPVGEAAAHLQHDMDELAAPPSGIVSMAGCVCSYTWGTGGIIRHGPRADCPVHGDEDRIRDAMAEAIDHPGRTVTR